MKKIIGSLFVVLAVVASLAIPASAAPSYDNPSDIRTAKRLTLQAFYGVSYAAQRRICNSYESRFVWTVRKVGKITFNNTPESVSMREAQKGVILALSQAC